MSSVMETEVMSVKTATNELPEGWRWETLGEVADNLDNKRKPINAAERETRQGDVPYYGATGQVGWIDKHLLDEEVVLVGEDGAPFLEPGRAKAYMVSGKAWVNNHAHVLRARHGMPNAYLMHFLNILDYSPYVSGTTRLKLTKGAMSKIPVPVAPLPQQRRIVSAIELQLGRLDAAVARLQAAKAKLKRYKQAVLKAAFTENDWPMTSIGDVYEVFVGSTPSRAKPALWNGNVPWVSSGEVAFCEIHETREKIAHEALNNSEKRLHPSGTVMLAMIGEGKTRGQAAILRIAAAHNQNTAAIRMPDSLHSPEYLYYFFLYEYENTRRVGSGNNQMALNKTRIQAIEIPMPDPETQARVALEIAERLDQVDAMDTNLDAELVRSTRLRQAVLKRAFEGRLG